MSAERLPCLTPGCPNTIQPATASRTGGYCGPCAGKRDREAREAHIRANRRDVDRFNGVTDPVEMLRLIHTPPRHDPLVRQAPAPLSAEALYLSLAAEQADRVMVMAINELKTDEHRADEIAKCLAAFTRFPLRRLQDAWLDRKRPYPPLIFRDADGIIRKRLVDMLGRFAKSLSADHVLSALAWIGDEEAQHFLQSADASKPRWTKGLHISPSQYARVAGWEIEDGKRRELILPECVALHPTPDQAHDTSAVRLCQERDGACPWCKTKLVNLLAIDVECAGLQALEAFGSRLNVLTCPVCTCYGTVHAETDDNGEQRWSEANVPPPFLPKDIQEWEPIPWSTVGVRLAPRHPLHASDWCLPTTLSQIGGHPAWVQDIAYPACLRCHRTMTFIAQLDQAAFPGHEGVYYAFACAACRTTATEYQQT